MCGIAGLLALDGHTPEQPVLRAMCDRLAHRGPDDEGYYVDGPVGARPPPPRIIDLAAAATSRMANEDGTVWVVFNGEIYNFQELRSRARGRGPSPSAPHATPR